MPTSPPAGVPAKDRPKFITLPPGVTPIAATNTGPATATPSRTQVTPLPLAHDASASPLPPPPPPQGSSSIDETTTIAASRAVSWALVFVDGSIHDISTTTVLGRSPDADAHAADHALTLDKTQRSVSRSHALLEPTAGGLRVRDLGSANGVVVVRSDGQIAQATQTQWVELEHGDEIELGEVVVRVQRQ